MYFIACKTSPISRNNARYDNAIKASLMMALEPRGAAQCGRSGGGSRWRLRRANAMAVFYGRHRLSWQVAGDTGRRGGWLGDGGLQAVGSQAGRAERS